jgi:uracil permease
MSKKNYWYSRKPSILESIPLSFQHLTAMFGATISSDFSVDPLLPYY